MDESLTQAVLAQGKAIEQLLEAMTGMLSGPAQAAPENKCSQVYGGETIPVQFRLPADMVRKIKHMAIESGQTMSELVEHMLTTDGSL